MANIFDSAKFNMFSITTTVMGYSAIWINSDTLEEFSARIHYKYPTPSEDLAGVEYFPTAPMMEFKKGDFDGLKALVDASSDELVTIEGIGAFYVRTANLKYDGDTITCELAPDTETPIP